MLKHKAYKFRIYPTQKQKVLLNKTFGCVRFVWNYNVECFNNNADNTLSVKDLRVEHSFLKEVSADALHQKARDFFEFKRQYFNKSRKKQIGKPSFKKKRLYNKYRLANKKFSLSATHIKIEKIGKIKVVLDRQIPKEVKYLSVTISKKPCGHFYASVCVEEDVLPKSKTHRKVGIDLGIKTFATQSDKVEIANPKFLVKSQDKLRRLQRIFSKKVKGSRRQIRFRYKIARLHERIHNQRLHFLHSYITELVNKYDVLVIEDLSVEAMLKNKNLSKNISDASWSLFRSLLTYKADWYGKKLIVVDRYFASSKTCRCGYVKQDLKLDDREWVCPSCKARNKRDLLASINILEEGLRIKSVGVDAD